MATQGLEYYSLLSSRAGLLVQVDIRGGDDTPPPLMIARAVLAMHFIPGSAPGLFWSDLDLPPPHVGVIECYPQRLRRSRWSPLRGCVRPHPPVSPSSDALSDRARQLCADVSMHSWGPPRSQPRCLALEPHLGAVQRRGHYVIELLSRSSSDWTTDPDFLVRSRIIARTAAEAKGRLDAIIDSRSYWQSAGWGSIVPLAAVNSLDLEPGLARMCFLRDRRSYGSSKVVPSMTVSTHRLGPAYLTDEEFASVQAQETNEFVGDVLGVLAGPSAS